MTTTQRLDYDFIAILLHHSLVVVQFVIDEFVERFALRHFDRVLTVYILLRKTN